MPDHKHEWTTSMKDGIPTSDPVRCRICQKTPDPIRCVNCGRVEDETVSSHGILGKQGMHSIWRKAAL